MLYLSECTYVCMSVTLRNANFLYTACTWLHYYRQQATVHGYSSMTDQFAQWTPPKDEGDLM